MKKMLISAVMAFACVAANAEGYQVNTLSAKQGGMAHTGIAQKLESESMYFNPAGLGFMDKTMSISGSITGLYPTCYAKIDGKEYETSNKVSTPLMLTAGFSIYDNLKAGVALYVPYGSSINWGKYWPGAVLNQSVEMKTFTLQPTISWKILPNLSIGGGLMISWGNVNLNKGLTTDATLNAIMQMMQPGAPAYEGMGIPASVNIKGNAAVAYGVNLGVMWDVSEKVTLGADFRTKQTMKVKTGDASVSYADETAEAILGNDLRVLNTQFAAEMPMPYVLGAGVTYKPVDKLTLAFDVQLTGWSTYKNLEMKFVTPADINVNQDITKKYKNSMAYRVGAQYALTDRFDVRAGVAFDTTPVNPDYYNPETPGMTKIEPAVGFSFRPMKNFSIDFTFLYVHGCGKKNVTCDYEDAVLKTALLKMNPQTPADMYTFPVKGDYNLHAISASLGFSYSF